MMDNPLVTLMLSHVLIAAAIALALSVAQQLSRKESAASRHNAWAVVLCVLIAIPALSFLPGSLIPRISTQAIDAATDLAQSSPATSTLATPGSNTAIPTTRLQIATDAAGAQLNSDNISFTRWLLGGWLALSLLQLIQLQRALNYVHVMRRSGDFVSPERATQTARICQAMGLKRQISVRYSDAISAPQTVGTFSPVVLLPAGWRKSSNNNVVEHALAHELAHIKRGDHYWVCLQFFARIVFPFNPVIWYVIDQMNREREAACDDWAMSLGTSPKAYASSLVSVAASLLPGFPPELAIPCLRSKNHLRRRIFTMLDQQKSHSTSATSRLSLIAGILAFAGAAVAAPPWATIAPVIRNVAAVELSASHNDRKPKAGDGLLFAAWEGDTEMVKQLLEQGADPDAVNRGRDPRTALIAAARQENWDVLRLLLDSGADVNYHARGDETPLMAVAHDQSTEAQAIMEELLARGARSKSKVRGDGTPLIAATRGGNTRAVELLLSNGANPDTWVEGDESAMFHAVIGGHTEIVSLLLAAGANPKASYRGDGTPLMLAIRHGHDDIAQMLIDARAPVNATVKGDGSALIDAARRNSVSTVQSLLAAGADVELAVRGDGNPLINAARRGHLETSQLLISHGADVNAHVPDDDTPLINAVWSNNSQLVALLLDEGANPNLQGDFDRKLLTRRTPLNQATPNSDIASLLLAEGAR